MKPSLRLSPIDREHIQELYDQAGIARDELPYTDDFDQLCRDFQDRTFKNADREQVYAAIVKYVRSSTCPSAAEPFVGLSDEQLKVLKSLLPRHSRAGKILPYSSEFKAARSEFSEQIGVELDDRDFWRGLVRASGSNRRQPQRRAVAVQA